MGGAVAFLAYRLCKSGLERGGTRSIELRPTLVAAE
jgi:hypothetical protein